MRERVWFFHHTRFGVILREIDTVFYTEGKIFHIFPWRSLSLHSRVRVHGKYGWNVRQRRPRCVIGFDTHRHFPPSPAAHESLLRLGVSDVRKKENAHQTKNNRNREEEDLPPLLPPPHPHPDNDRHHPYLVISSFFLKIVHLLTIIGFPKKKKTACAI